MPLNYYRHLYYTVLIIVISNIGNISQFLYQFFGGKYLAPSDFGLLSSINSYIAIICLPLSLIQISAVKTFAEIFQKYKLNYIKINREFSKFVLENLVLTTVYIFIIFILRDEIFSFLQLSNRFHSIIIIINIFLMFFLSPYIIFAQVQKQYKTHSFLGTSQLTLRFIFYVSTFFLFNSSYIAGVVGNIIGLIILIVFCLYYFRKKIFFKIDLIFNHLKIKNIKNFYIHRNLNLAIWVTAYIIIGGSFDLVLFRKLYPGDLSGYYAGISTLAKIPMFLSSLTIAYSYTESSYDSFNLKKDNTIVYFSFLFSFLIMTGVIVIFWFFGELLLSFFFSEKYANFHLEFVIISIAYSFFALTKIFSFILLSRNYWKFFLFIFPTLFISMIFLYFNTNSILFYSKIILITFFIHFLIILMVFIINKRNLIG